MSGIQALISKFESNQQALDSKNQFQNGKSISRLYLSPNPNINNYIKKSNVEEYPIKKSTAEILKDPQSKKFDEVLGRTRKEKTVDKHSEFELRNNEPGLGSKRVSKISSKSEAADGDSLTGFRIVSPRTVKNESININDTIEDYVNVTIEGTIDESSTEMESNSKKKIEKEIVPAEVTKKVHGTSIASTAAPVSSDVPGIKTEKPEFGKSLDETAFRHNVTRPLEDTPSTMRTNSPKSYGDLDRFSNEIDAVSKSNELEESVNQIPKEFELERSIGPAKKSLEEVVEEVTPDLNYYDRSIKRTRGFEIPKRSDKRKSLTTMASSAVESDSIPDSKSIPVKNLVTTPNGSPHEAHSDIFDKATRRMSTPNTPPIDTDLQGNAYKSKVKITQPIQESLEGVDSRDETTVANQLLMSPIKFPNESSRGTAKEVVAKNGIESDGFSNEPISTSTPKPNVKYITKIEETLDALQDDSDLPKSKEIQSQSSRFNKKFGGLKKLFVKRKTMSSPIIIVDSTPSPSRSHNQRYAFESPLSNKRDEEVFHDANDEGFDNTKLIVPNLYYQQSDSPTSFIPTRPAPSPARSKTKGISRVDSIRREDKIVSRSLTKPPTMKELPALPTVAARKERAGHRINSLMSEAGSQTQMSQQQQGEGIKSTKPFAKQRKRDSLFQKEETIRAIEESIHKNRSSQSSSSIDEGYFRPPHSYRIFLSKVDKTITATSLYPKRNSINVATQTTDGLKQLESVNKRRSVKKSHIKRTERTINTQAQAATDPNFENQYWQQFMNQDNFMNYFEKFVDDSFTYVKQT